MPQWVQTLATKPDDLSSIPWTQMKARKSGLLHVVLGVVCVYMWHTTAHTLKYIYTFSHTQVHKINKKHNEMF